jgi:hypothetical protein
MGSQSVSRRTFDGIGRADAGLVSLAAPSGADPPSTLEATDVLPAGPGEPVDEVFPLRERLRFRDNLGLGLRDVRQRPAFAALPRGPWLVFIAIACYWQANAEAWPSQETIAGFSGYTPRAVRDYVEALVRVGIVRLRRERRPNGSERIYYAPGSVTVKELAAFVERFPNRPAKATHAHPPEASSATPPTPPEMVSGAPPEASSMELRDQDLEPSSCAGRDRAPPPPTIEQEQPRVTKEDRDVARSALAERMKRRHPKRSALRWFDRTDVEMVAACSALIDGDRDAKLRAHVEAIDGAFHASKDGPPTARFIWGKPEHFLDHVEQGGRRARAEERQARRRADEDRGAASAGRAGVAGVGALARGSPPSREDLAKTRAEFEELAANAAPPFRGHLESMAARYREFERKAE